MSQQTLVRPWTDEEVSYLLANTSLSAARVGEALSRTASSVSSKRRGLAWQEWTAEASSEPWSDEEIGFVEDHRDWTAKQIAEELGRKPGSVASIRVRISKGWTRQRDPYTAEEEAFVLSTPNLTAQQVAKYLGRTEKSVVHRRCLLREVKGARFNEFTKDPHHIGGRPLIAKTCTKCGRVLSAVWFSFAPSMHGWSSRCKRCADSRGAGRAKTEKQVEQTRQFAKRMQDMTSEHATRSGLLWLSSDHDTLSDPDLTVVEKALSLGRTYHAVVGACSVNGYASKTGIGDPDKDQWFIDNPNAAVAS